MAGGVTGHGALCRRSDNQQIAVLQHIRCDPILHHSDPGKIVNAQLDDFGHISGIVAGHIVIVMSAVDNDIRNHRRRQEVHLQNAVILFFNAHVGSLDGCLKAHRADTVIGKGEGEAHR